MLDIRFKNNSAYYALYVGQERSLSSSDIDNIEEVSADGDELDYINANFENIPNCRHKRVVVWKGETARFIVRHW